MLEVNESVTLRSGETVGLAVIRAPDPEWAGRIEAMLLHKGEPWNWQNSEFLRRHTDTDTRFFVLHRDGAPFANIMLVMAGGVALLGHVWTAESERGGGASSVLMERVLAEFRRREGRVMYLGTEFDSAPWHYYRRRGFEAIEPGSGTMVLYAESGAAFESRWFGAVTDVVVEPLDWPHLATSVPLFVGSFDGVVRLAGTRLFGRRIAEEQVLSLIRDQSVRRPAGQPASALVLRDAAGPAVVGLAAWRPHPLWNASIVLDLHCHPDWWRRAPELLQALALPPGRSVLAYADAALAAKCAALETAGFSPAGRLPQAASAAAGSPPIDVAVFTRRSSLSDSN